MRPKWLPTTRLHAGFFVLVIYALAWPALATELTYCANIGAYMDCENNAACCGPDLSSATTGANLADTAVDGSVTTDTNGGTMYGCQYTGNTPPTAAQIIAGSAPCVSAKTKTSVTAGAVAFNSAGSNRFDGLTASTSYRAAYVQQDGTGRPILEVVTTAPYETLAGGGAGGADLTGTVYVVDSVNGNDANNGLSVAAAWKTIAKVNNNVTASGSKVCLMDDSAWNERLVIDWGGASDDYGMVLACYVDTGDSNKLVEYDTGTGTGRGARPRIGNDLNPTCIAAANCGGSPTDYFAGKSVTSGYIASVEIESNYVEVAGLDVSYGAGIGIQAKGSGLGFPGSRHHIVVRDNKISYVGKQAISFLNGVQNFAILRNDVTNHSQCYIEAVRNGVTTFSTRATLCDGGAWGGAIIASRNAPAYGLIEDNDVHDVMGEGIGVGQGATRTIVRGNRVGNTHSTSIYTDMALENVIESNIIWGADTGGAGDYSGGAFGTPFGGEYAANVEKDDYSHNRCTIWRNNIAVDGPAAFRLNVFNDAGAYAAGLDITAYAYGNTNLSLNSYGWRMTRRVTEIESKSNIVYLDASLGAAAAVSFQSVDAGYSFDFDYSLWRTSPSNGAGVGANDVTGGLVLATNDADWETVDYATNKPTVDDFRLQAGSAGIGAGDPALETEALPCSLSSASFGTFPFEHMAYPFAVDDGTKQTNWSKKLYYDFEGTARDATTPDMGALEYAP